MTTIKLSKQQKEIVESEENNILVIAASGSGKTYTLVERVRHLLEVKGVSPEGLVCITFTNAAADEMKKRLKDVDGIGDAFIGTIHSFANRIYKQSGLKYQLFTREAQIKLTKRLLELNDFHFLTMDLYLLLLEAQDKAEAGEIDPEEASPDKFLGPAAYSDFMDLMEISERVRKEENYITFTELIVKTREYYATLDAELEHVMLDEAQDISTVEYQFIEGLNGKNNFLVGDDWQNIYSFKGANVHIFKNLAKKKDVSVYYLTENYRSAEEIIEVGNKIIEQVSGRIQKDIVVKSKEKGKVLIDSQRNIDRYIRLLQKEENLNDWFILCRNNRDVVELAAKLRAANVPVDTFKRSGMSAEDLEMQMMLPSVKVLTVHVSKGLENKNVLLYGNFPMKLPSWYRTNDKTEEERRVMYVGVTRAKENLIILN